ncbi:hypothetical protein [Aureivirga marina]|uniref:hypothetical protein n=1 Tax=Aureivirga marina TaxID=1182451 RepID=UPI0018C96B78|nr:hypothetical protein [Aureivirga marina]
MKDKSLIIGYDNNKNKVDIEILENWLSNIDNHRIDIANLIFNRLYNRYIKPFKNNSKENKSGFLIMASCCLLIESYMSFKVREFLSTHKKSARCFGYFFVTEERFKIFSQGGLDKNQYLNLDKKVLFKGKGVPQKFYKGVRCGILHNGETKNSWRIRRDSKKLLKVSKNKKVINANLFLDELHEVLKEFRQTLIDNENTNSELWKVCILRLEKIIKDS